MQTLSTRGFTVGICASDNAARLPSLVSFVLNEDYGAGLELRRVAVVASACPELVLSQIRKLAQSDERLTLINEPSRRGKAEAINRIMENSSGDYLVMVNSDAFPAAGSVGELLTTFDGKDVGAVSATPVFAEGKGVLQHALSLMWSAHSMMSLNLNHAGLSNHACDELIAVRRDLVSGLPDDLVNDGAYFGGLAKARGFKVKFLTRAKVTISVPHVAADLIRQRRRIIFGHVQVWRKLGAAPRTIESMMFMDPVMSLRTLKRVLAKRPSLVLTFPFLLVSEGAAALLALLDVLTSTGRHRVWRRNVE